MLDQGIGEAKSGTSGQGAGLESLLKGDATTCVLYVLFYKYLPCDL